MSTFEVKLDEEGPLINNLHSEYTDDIMFPDHIPVTINFDPHKTVGEVEECEVKGGEIHATVHVTDEELFEEKVLTPCYVGEEDGDTFRVTVVPSASFVDNHIDPEFDNEPKRVEENGD